MYLVVLVNFGFLNKKRILKTLKAKILEVIFSANFIVNNQALLYNFPIENVSYLGHNGFPPC